MQTFLVHRIDSANWLQHRFDWFDKKRLHNQLNECKVIAKALNGEKAWANHPAVEMWRHNVPAFYRYMFVVANTLGKPISELVPILEQGNKPGRWPAWFLCEEFFAAHRCNLIRKLPEHYGPMWLDAYPNDIYVWPKLEGKQWTLRRKKVGAKNYMEASSFRPYAGDL